MAGRRAPREADRGGDGIQAPRPARARLITGAGSFAALGGVALVAVAQAGRVSPVAGALCVAALIVEAIALVLRWPRLVPWAVLAASAAYVIGREGKSVVDPRATLIGAALLLSAELATWSTEHDARIKAERSLTVRRIATVTLLVAAAMLVDVLLLGTAGLSAESGVLLAAIGVAASVSAVALVLRLLRATPADERRPASR
jgi:hypothetical protein